ncbi:hypothetical protein DY000_02008135 [Brassica cretica]|uniref:Uncharacterized protein n=1 Tax=Brassica cretica TaxID=69181 RepID=A0ABQ7BWL2_BRACR|nr:hypothetical protein DY000_02008135 [Brassica cretica]
MVVSLTVANSLVRRILVDNGSSSNIIFQTAYQDPGLDESALTRRITPLVGFSGERGSRAPHILGPQTNNRKGTRRVRNEKRRPRNSPRLNIDRFAWSLLDSNRASLEVVKTQSPFDSRPGCEASYLENRIPATITPRKSSGSRIHVKLISSSRYLGTPENSGQIRSTKKQDEIPHFPRKGPLGRPIFCVHSEEIRPQKAFEVLNQPGGDDRGSSPRNPKSLTTPRPFQRRGTHLKSGSSMRQGRRSLNPPRSEENPISPGRKLVEKPPGVLDPRLAIPQTMEGGTLSALCTTPRLIIRGNAELSARDQPNRWHTTKSHDEQAETETSQQGDEVLRQDRVHELSKSKDVESGKVWHLDFHPHQQNFNKSDSGFCRSSMQHGNSIVTSFRAVECEIPTGTGSSLS